jgi:hypothetical protein
VKVLEAGVVGNLDYKIIEAGRADDLYVWLKDNKYSFAGNEATHMASGTSRPRLGRRCWRTWWASPG